MENITDNDNFKKWFKSSKAVNADGTPMVLFHQTNKENEDSIKNLGFEHGRGKAILSDNGVPNGFFFKPSDSDIGLGKDVTQIPVYLSLQNPLVVDSRRELLFKVSEMDMNVYEADYQFYLKDKEFQKKFDDLHNELKVNRDLYKSRNHELNEILDEWGKWGLEAASNMRVLMTNALIKNNHDGVILKNDSGSFNRTVTSYIAFYPEQIKSTNNNGDFNPNEKSIMKEKELNEQIKRIREVMGLNESLTDIVYHFTRFNILYRILKTNQFITTAAVASKSDMTINHGKYFFLSTTRSKATGYVVGDVKLVLDGRKLNQRFKGKAVDYWQYSKDRKNYTSDADYKNALSSNEQEDRIITNEPYINDAISYIREIHILVGKRDRIYKSTLDFIRDVCTKNGIGLYFYDFRQNWLLQNKSGLVNPEDAFMELRPGNADDHDDYRDKSEFYNYSPIAFLYAFNDEANYKRVLDLIGDKADDFIESYKYEVSKHLSKYASYEDETKSYYKNRISNVRAGVSPMVRQLLKLLSDDMRKNGVNNIGDYIDLKRERPDLRV